MRPWPRSLARSTGRWSRAGSPGSSSPDRHEWRGGDNPTTATPAIGMVGVGLAPYRSTHDRTASPQRTMTAGTHAVAEQADDRGGRSSTNPVGAAYASTFS